MDRLSSGQIPNRTSVGEALRGMKTALWWIRRDLRLEHNVALGAALENAERVIPIFVLDPTLLRSP